MKARVAFSDDYSSNIWVRKSANGGATWAARSAAAEYGGTPNVNVAGGRSVVVFNIPGVFTEEVDSVHD